MRWRTAHRNRREQLGLVIPRPRPKRKRALFDASWRKWIETIAPTFVSTTVPGSLWERLTENARTYRERHHFGPMSLPMSLPRFDTAEGTPALQPDNTVRYERRWVSLLPKQIWMAQKGKCAECGELTPFEHCAKRICSFEIICTKCYAKTQPMVMIVDDFDFPQRPRQLKEFIFGDNWNAYQKVSE